MWTPKLSKGAQPLYLQLVDAMANAISTGEFAIGEKLPPQRQLAWHLGINLSTVTKAFQQAAKQHLISGEVGRGTYVLGQSSEAELFLLKQNTANVTIDLSTHIPATGGKDTDLEQTLNQMMQGESGLAEYLTYHSPQALKRIRILAAKWLEQLSYNIDFKHCIATTTAQNALLVTLLKCCRQDDVVLVNELTFPGMKAAARQLGLKLVGVKVDEQGIIPQALDLAIRTSGAKVLVSDPIMQNPTGSVMGEKRRKLFIDVLVKHNILFIEEYVIGGLSNNKPVSCSIKKQSILITSFAKMVSPGIRFAVISGKHPVINQLVNESHSTSWQLSPLMAEVACQWIDTGVTIRRQQWQWQEITKRFRLFKRVFPEREYFGNHHICPHVWLPVNQNVELAVAKLHKLGVEVVPASLFAVSRNFPDNIRVSLTAAKTIQQLKIALNIIRDAGVINKVHRENAVIL